jgi:2-polyprenyl-3-methyl-5-hydroxy-6-metoxy-1,4-benzoquinol methylase
LASNFSVVFHFDLDRNPSDVSRLEVGAVGLAQRGSDEPYTERNRGAFLRGQESERLSGARGELEQLRTQAILAQNLPRAPAEIFDVGGAAGIHAFPLAKQGHQVHLIDPVELHLEQARSYVARSGVTL